MLLSRLLPLLLLVLILLVQQQLQLQLLLLLTVIIRDKWVPVTREWRVLRLRMEERPPTWRVTANILNKQSRRGVAILFL